MVNEINAICNYPKHPPLNTKYLLVDEAECEGKCSRSSEIRKRQSHAEKLKDGTADLCAQLGEKKKKSLHCVHLCAHQSSAAEKYKETVGVSEKKTKKLEIVFSHVSSRAIRVCSTLKSSLEPQETAFIIYFLPVNFSQSLHELPFIFTPLPKKLQSAEVLTHRQVSNTGLFTCLFAK